MELVHKMKQCRVILERIDVTPYRNNRENVVDENCMVVENDIANQIVNQIDAMPVEYEVVNIEEDVGDCDSDDENTVAALLSFGFYYLLKKIRTRERESRIHKRMPPNIWVREWLEKRSTEGAYAKLLKELRNGDHGERRLYHDFIRMSGENFDYLLRLITPLIQKSDTRMRKTISVGERLALTLHYLSTGQSFHSLQYLFRIAQCTISKIIPEVLDAIWTVLKNEYIRVRFLKLYSHMTRIKRNHFFLLIIRHQHQRRSGESSLIPFSNGIFRIALVPLMGNIS